MAVPQASCGFQPPYTLNELRARLISKTFPPKTFPAYISQSLVLYHLCSRISPASSASILPFCIHPIFFLPAISCSFCLLSLRCVTTFYPKYIQTPLNSTVLFSGHMVVYSKERGFFSSANAMGEVKV